MARPRSGYRLKDGTSVVGTTTVTSRFKDSGGLIQWAHRRGLEHPDEPLYQARDEAGAIGTYVHERWEAYVRETKAPERPEGFTDTMMEQATTSLQAAVDWLSDSGLRVLPHEKPLISEKYKYGGTPDALICGKRGMAVGDWKTNKGGFYVETWMQMAAYIQLIEENDPSIKLVDGVHLVRFGKIGGEFDHKHIPRHHPALVLAFDQFVRLVDAYYVDKELKDLT